MRIVDYDASKEVVLTNDEVQSKIDETFKNERNRLDSNIERIKNDAKRQIENIEKKRDKLDKELESLKNLDVDDENSRRIYINKIVQVIIKSMEFSYEVDDIIVTTLPFIMTSKEKENLVNDFQERYPEDTWTCIKIAVVDDSSTKLTVFDEEATK